VFSASNVSRTDAAADASKDELGFGIKTFLSPGDSTSQKIAEFDSVSQRLRNLRRQPRLLAAELARLRNDRIAASLGLFDINSIIYHLIARRTGQMIIYEEPMNNIESDNIRIISDDAASLKFEDGNNEYKFYYSKSTLYKTFNISNYIHTINVDIIESPFDNILQLFQTNPAEAPSTAHTNAFVILPLYSKRGQQKYVPERSGLNQWNAGGRPRDAREVYIPIPIEVHRLKPNFFPPRNTSFSLRLPSGRELDAKVCQENNKALMSNPNKDLGEWLLDHVLHQPRNLLVTYQDLEDIGIDSVMVTRINNQEYQIDFKQIDSYERFAAGEPIREEE